MRQLTYVAPDTLEWWDVPEPTLKEAGDALVRPLTVSNCDLDPATIRGLTQFSATAPFPLGHEFTAEVVEVGHDVRSVRPGDRVVVSFQICCGVCGRCRRGLTGFCEAVARGSMYGFGPLAGAWGGALSDLVRVPYADFMLVPLPEGVRPDAVPAVSDNICDAMRCVLPVRDRPGAEVLIITSSPSWLYAIELALAFGASTVHYADRNPDRREIAQTLGAEPIEVDTWPERLGSYPVTASATFNPAGLACAIRSTEPGGICTSAAPFFEAEIPLPVAEMYGTGVTFVTGRVNARAHMPEALDLAARGLFHPERVTSRVVPWEDAADALVSERGKLVFTRA